MYTQNARERTQKLKRQQIKYDVRYTQSRVRAKAVSFIANINTFLLQSRICAVVSRITRVKNIGQPRPATEYC